MKRGLTACCLSLIVFIGHDVHPQDAHAPAQPQPADVPTPLPPRLLTAVAATFPTYHIPAKGDLTGRWAKGSRSNPPFMCQGDFTGGGGADVALILLGTKAWKLAIFHQSESGFELAYSIGDQTEGPDALVPSPQLLSVKLLPKGKPYVYVSIGVSGRQEKRYTFNTDAIEFTAEERFLALLFWKSGKYQTMEFSD